MQKIILSSALALMISVDALGASEAQLDDVVATVDGEEIYMGDVVAFYQASRADIGDATLAESYDQILDFVIVQSILSKKADDREIDKYILRNAEKAVLLDSFMKSEVEASIDEDDIQEEYDRVVADMPDVEEYNASHILVASEDEAKELKGLIDDGADFAETAKEKSTGPSGPSGGELGWFSAGQMVKEFEDAAFSLEVGAVSEPVQTQFGWHLIKLNEKRIKPKPTLDEARAEIQNYLAETMVNSIITDAKTDVDIDLAEDVNKDQLDELVGE